MYPNVGPSASFSESSAPSHMHSPQTQFFGNQGAFNQHHYRSNEYAPLSNWQMPQVPANAAQHRFPHLMNNAPHSKSFSLPVDFHSPFANAPQQTPPQPQQPPPPPRVVNSFVGDVPLPPGWEAEKTATGQIYYMKWAFFKQFFCVFYGVLK